MPPPFRKHVFVCLNERPPESPRGDCTRKGSPELVDFFTTYKRRRPGPLALVIVGEEVWPVPRSDDVLVAISTSGNSGNVLAALDEARRRGLGTIALVGYDGGRIALLRQGRTPPS